MAKFHNYLCQCQIDIRNNIISNGTFRSTRAFNSNNNKIHLITKNRDLIVLSSQSTTLAGDKTRNKINVGLQAESK